MIANNEAYQRIKVAFEALISEGMTPGMIETVWEQNYKAPLAKIEIQDENLPNEMAEQIIELEKQAKDITERQKRMKDAILQAMKEKEILKIEAPEVTITYVAPTTTEKLDSKALKKELPDIYDTYCQISQRADYIKITIKEKKDGELDD